MLLLLLLLNLLLLLLLLLNLLFLLSLVVLLVPQRRTRPALRLEPHAPLARLVPVALATQLLRVTAVASFPDDGFGHGHGRIGSVRFGDASSTGETLRGKLFKQVSPPFFPGYPCDVFFFAELPQDGLPGFPCGLAEGGEGSRQVMEGGGGWDFVLVVVARDAETTHSLTHSHSNTHTLMRETPSFAKDVPFRGGGVSFVSFASLRSFGRREAMFLYRVREGEGGGGTDRIDGIEMRFCRPPCTFF